MSNIHKSEDDDGGHGRLAGFLAHDWPYLVVLLLSLIGVALSSLSSGRMVLYWEVAVPVFALACFHAHAAANDNRERLRAARQEILHWLAVFLAIRLLLYPQVSQMLNADAIALMLLIVLALGLFAAGNRIGSWRIALVGALLAAAVPGIAWLERSALIVSLGVSGALCFFLFVWLRQSREQPE